MIKQKHFKYKMLKVLEKKAKTMIESKLTFQSCSFIECDCCKIEREWLLNGECGCLTKESRSSMKVEKANNQWERRPYSNKYLEE